MCAHALNVGNGLVEVLHCDTGQPLSILSGYQAEAQYTLRISGLGAVYSQDIGLRLSILSGYQAEAQ